MIYMNGQHHSTADFILEVQVYSEKCTGRYFKVRDDDLSSKQGSLCTLKKILIKNTKHICYKIKT